MACVGCSHCEARIRSHDRRHSDLPLPEVEGASRCARTFGPRTHSCGREERSRGGPAPTSQESAISPHRLESPQGRSDQRTYLGIRGISLMRMFGSHSSGAGTCIQKKPERGSSDPPTNNFSSAALRKLRSYGLSQPKRSWARMRRT